MAHPGQLLYIRGVKEKWPRYFRRVSVLDIGSLDINGSNQLHFEDCLYLGVDVDIGKNVDIVSKGHELALPDNTFDVVISSECFEHDMHYRATLQNAVRLLRPGGMFVFTCATTGRPEHGTARTTPEAAPLLQRFEEWANYYKNLTEFDIRDAIAVDDLFVEYEFRVDYNICDLYFWGIKRGEWSPNSHGSFHESASSREAKLALVQKNLAEALNREEMLRTHHECLQAQIEQLTNRLNSTMLSQADTQAMVERKVARIQRLESTWHQKLAVGLYRTGKKLRRRVSSS